LLKLNTTAKIAGSIRYALCAGRLIRAHPASPCEKPVGHEAASVFLVEGKRTAAAP
jgi:hypothetical protein